MALKVLPHFYSPVGFQKLTVSSSAVGFTLPSVGVTIRAVIFSMEGTATTDTIRIKVDGNDPTSTDGLLIYDGDVVEITNVNMVNNFKGIARAGDCVLQIHYFAGGGP